MKKTSKVSIPIEVRFKFRLHSDLDLLAGAAVEGEGGGYGATDIITRYVYVDCSK
jgi:hypothetical protein